MNGKYNVRSELLARCIGTGRLKGDVVSDFIGFNGSKQVGYVLLTLFLIKVINPDFLSHYRIFNRFLRYERKVMDIYNSLSDIEVDCICREVMAIYEHTQRCCNEKKITTVQLGRKLNGRYADMIAELKETAEMRGEGVISFEMDILNSFNDADEYHGRVKLELDIPASDILYCHDFIDSKHVNSWLVEPHEWVVINRSLTGIVTVPVSAIKISY
ncbi:hypothetical protein RCO15_20495 [Escherichia coli]|uniref:hypothetical protein n=3 Tax=Enterobacteriaceae TaxID=543 RepID=UPI002892F08D|nr:hypothetical protein [Escherichia coli]MBC0166009.1 hypothetical protein [Escherichia coli]MED9619351.1 hypothetical protein [Escherichia coli]